MGKKPLITVVTLTYRNFNRVFTTIDSVFSQKYPRIEYIISDDGSDNFPEMEISDYINKNCPINVKCTVLHHVKNIGTVKNINLGYKKSRGEILINLSSGDVFFNPYVVEQIVDRFNSTDCDVLVTSRILYQGNFEPICLLPHYEEREIITSWRTGIEQYKAFIKGKFYDMASGSAMSYSRKVLDKVGYFDERYMLWEDGPFLAKYLQIGQLEYAYDIVSIWYEAGGVSSKRKGKRKHIKSQLDVDTERFNSGERLLRIREFTLPEKRIVYFKNLQFKYKQSRIKYVIPIAFPVEFLNFYKYAKDRERRIPSDLVEINRLLTMNYDGKL